MAFSQIYCEKAEAENLKIYSIRYGDSLFSKKFITYGYKGSKELPFAWKFYLVKYKGKNILIDTGFKSSRMKRIFSIKDYEDPLKILAELNVSPESVDFVILTHSHFDHAGNAWRFKNAKFIMNKHAYRKLKVDPSMKKLIKLTAKGKNLDLFDKEKTFLDFFQIKWIGGHSPGSSIVLLKDGDKKYCFTGDEVYLKENIEKNEGIGSAYSHRRNMGFIKFIRNSDYAPLIFHQPDKDKERITKITGE